MGPNSTEVSGTVRSICDVLWRDERWGRSRENILRGLAAEERRKLAP